eukprot:CAMPEP_0178409982 /NCGR_PEP_ID=MMETSP0689_2-20121128/20742_1 /TAXON_ID=160604 /ORGANISM="Amphidinium massartii, Strain CS-259" /LENGTH=777 /DNA_ID=CAMNT_0020031139 /DNA_START=53 /DNA_END=2386 /DNA_ORIENTATION=+
MMRTAGIVLTCALLCANLGEAAKLVSRSSLATREGELETAWGRELDAAGASPIKKVVTLLTAMKKQLEDEGSKESEMYDEMVCWCTTNTKEKTEAIKDAETKVGELETGIQEKAARKGALATEVDKLKKDIPAAQDSLKTARSIREKEQSEFSAMETDMIQAISNLKNAISILGRHQGAEASLLQLDSPMGATMQEVLRDVALKYDLMMSAASPAVSSGKGASLLDVSSKKTLRRDLIAALGGENSEGVLPLDIAQRKLAETAQAAKPAGAAFMQAQQPIFKSYNGRSSKIFGILSQMLDEFEANLAHEQEVEKTSQASFDELKATQTAYIEASKEKLDMLETEHSEVSKALSDANEDLDLTRKQRAADVEFLRNLKLQCQDLDSQWEERSKTRTEELASVAEALEILTADDAKDLFVKSVPSFLQESSADASAAEAQRRSRAVLALRKAAADPAFGDDDFLSSLADSWRSRHGSTVLSAPAVQGPRSQLSTLAVTAQLDSFTKVKEAMDKMVAQLKTQQQEEAEEKAFCNKEFDVNEKATYEKTEQKEDLESEIDSLSSAIATLTKEVEVATKEVADTKVAMKKASETREKENTEFQTIVSEQRATQTILNKALTRLADFYKKKALLQQSETPESPVKFTAYKKNAGSSPVMNLLEQIIGDSTTLEAESVKTEKSAQAAYETFIKDSNALIDELTAAITAKNKATAAAEGDRETAKANLGSTEDELSSLSDYKADLHSRCDWLLKNFEARQTARLQEMEAIQHAKGILSGSAQAPQ